MYFTRLLLFLLILTSCSQSLVHDRFAKEKRYMFHHPCWGESSLVRLYIKWNWLHYGEVTKTTVKTDKFFMRASLVRYDDEKRLVFQKILHESPIEISAKSSHRKMLFSGNHQKMYHFSSVKAFLMNDLAYFSEVEMDDYSDEEKTQRQDLETMYKWKSLRDWRDQYMVARARQGDRCHSTFMQKSPHLLRLNFVRVTPYLHLEDSVLTYEIPLNKVVRHEGFFDPKNLASYEVILQSERVALSVGVSLLMERFDDGPSAISSLL